MNDQPGIVSPSSGHLSGSPLPDALGQYAETLGLAIEDAWRARQGNVGAFPEVAARCLSNVDVPDALDPIAILRTVAMAKHLVRQADPRGGFGSPPITLWRSRDFFVSALFWFDGTTAIHDHEFSGAFRVLAGGSVHAPYTFARSEEITHRLVLGDLELDGPELLTVGDVRQIEPGTKFIHALFHLERPSVTLVVRTYNQPTGTPQYRYLRPGVAYDNAYRDGSLEIRFRSVLAIANLDPDAGAQAACELIADEDLWAGYLLTRRWFDSVDRAERLERLLDALARRHGRVVVPLRSAFEGERRTLSIATRRRLVADPEHRLFLALLLNLPDRPSVSKVLAQRFPGIDTGSLLARWVRELAAPSVRGRSGLVMDDAELEAIASDLEAGRTGTLGQVPLADPPPEMLADLFGS